MARFNMCLYGGQVIEPASGLSGTYDVAFDGRTMQIERWFVAVGVVRGGTYDSAT